MRDRKYAVKYNEETYNFLCENAKDYTIKELAKILREQYHIEVDNKKLAQYCIKMGIKYKYEHRNKSHSNIATQIGTIIRKTDDGMLKIKVDNHKWKYLQRKIYEQYYNVKLKDDEYIIFLDQNRRNFNINNLKRITRQESALLSRLELYSKNALATETGIAVVKLRNKLKNVK